MYIKHDGNGGVNISKSFGVIITIMIFLLGAVASMAYSYGTISNKVDSLIASDKETKLDTAQLATNLKADTSKIAVDLKVDQDKQDIKIEQHDKDIAVITTKLDIVIDKLDKIDRNIIRNNEQVIAVRINNTLNTEG